MELGRTLYCYSKECSCKVALCISERSRLTAEVRGRPIRIPLFTRFRIYAVRFANRVSLLTRLIKRKNLLLYYTKHAEFSQP
jgi:hypothetical protein